MYYGTEIRLKAGAEIDGNDAPHDSSGRAYFGDHLTTANLPATQSHAFHRHIQRLNQIHKATPALQKGAMERFGDSDNDFWVIRNFNAGESYAVVGLSQWGSTISVNNVRGGVYRDAVSGNTITVPEGGTLTFEVKGGSAGIYVLNGPGKIGVDGDFLR